MDRELKSKTPRRRVANFTAHEKMLLAQLIKRRPIVQSKRTDGKAVAKKQVAWSLITQEFNSNGNVHKRETITLKRAWDNMKALTRKACTTERGNLSQNNGSQVDPASPQHEAIINMVAEATSVMNCEIKNQFDSDSAILDSIDSTQKVEVKIEYNHDDTGTCVEDGTLDILETEEKIGIEETEVQERFKSNCTPIYDTQTNTDLHYAAKKHSVKRDQIRRPIDYIRREAMMRIKYLENKNKIEMQILSIQLENEQIKMRAALLEEERKKVLLECAKIELENVKKKIN